MDDVDEVMESGHSSGEGAADGGVVEVPDHRQLRVALKQREHGGKRCAKLVFEFLLEALEFFDGPETEVPPSGPAQETHPKTCCSLDNIAPKR
jgi:hypothetical protein